MRTDRQTKTRNKGNDACRRGDAAVPITCNSEPITATTIDGVTYYSTTRRGVDYTAYATSWGQWAVVTRRKALGRCNAGGARYYSDLAAVAQGCAAFAALAVFHQMQLGR